MKFLSPLVKYVFPIGLLPTLLVSEAASHPAQAGEAAFGHALLSTDHVLALIIMGVLAAVCMMSQKRLIGFIGNSALLGSLLYVSANHSAGHSVLYGLEFFLVSGFISLAAWRLSYFVIQASHRPAKICMRIGFKALGLVDGIISFPNARAHCDIPCKIYDPYIATVSALSVIRLIDIMEETQSTGDSSSGDFHNTMSRCIQRKEEESEKLKQEVRIIWGDYFKEPQFEKFPEIHDLAHEIMMLASAAKQTVDREKALKLLELVNKFSEIFWSTKDVETERKIAPYPPSLEIVRPIL